MGAQHRSFRDRVFEHYGIQVHLLAPASLLL
jgi:hypothetical protein